VECRTAARPTNGASWPGVEVGRSPVPSPAKGLPGSNEGVLDPSCHRHGSRKKLTADHIISLSVCPELANQALNIKVFPAALNSSKKNMSLKVAVLGELSSKCLLAYLAKKNIILSYGL